jgi:hypothetical protein
MRKHNVESAINSLIRKGCVIKKPILGIEGIIKVERGSLGNRSLGILDFLHKYNGYIVEWKEKKMV